MQHVCKLFFTALGTLSLLDQTIPSCYNDAYYTSCCVNIYQSCVKLANIYIRSHLSVKYNFSWTKHVIAMFILCLWFLFYKICKFKPKFKRKSQNDISINEESDV